MSFYGLMSVFKWFFMKTLRLYAWPMVVCKSILSNVQFEMFGSGSGSVRYCRPFALCFVEIAIVNLIIANRFVRIWRFDRCHFQYEQIPVFFLAFRRRRLSQGRTVTTRDIIYGCRCLHIFFVHHSSCTE